MENNGEFENNRAQTYGKRTLTESKRKRLSVKIVKKGVEIGCRLPAAECKKEELGPKGIEPLIFRM